jgi:hypothetical protein
MRGRGVWGLGRCVAGVAIVNPESWDQVCHVSLGEVWVVRYPDVECW